MESKNNLSAIPAEEFAARQQVLDIDKWLASERAGRDLCGTMSWCAHCVKAEVYPCAKAKFREEMEKALESFLEKEEGKRSEKRWRRRAGFVLLGAVLSMLLCFPAVWNRGGRADSFPKGQEAGKEVLCSGKRLAAFSQGSVWRMVRQEDEKGRLLGIRHDFENAIRRAAGKRSEILSKNADGFRW